MKIKGLGNRITNDEVTDFIRGYYQPLTPFLQELREDGKANEVPIILEETESYLNTLLDLTKPKKILEIGAAIGYSAAYFASKCPDASIISIEKDERYFQIANDNIKKASLDDRVTFILGDASEVMHELDGNIFDFIFLDAAKSHYLKFLHESLKLSKKGSIIVSDNVLMHGMTVYYNIEKYRKHRTNVRKMREYIDYIHNTDRLNTSLLAIGDGICVSYVKK